MSRRYRPAAAAAAVVDDDDHGSAILTYRHWQGAAVQSHVKYPHVGHTGRIAVDRPAPLKGETKLGSGDAG